MSGTEDESTGRVRASDAEREKVAETLRNAVAEGRLSLEEGDERLAALYAMKFRDELPALSADLPAPDTGAGGQAGPWGQNPWGQGPWGRGGRWGRRDPQDGDGTGGQNAADPGAAGPWGPGSGGPGPSGPGQWGPGPWRQGPPDSGPWGYGPGYGPGGYGPGHGPWGPGPWGPGPWRHGPRGPWRLVRLAILVALIATGLAIGGGHFFWPIIPITFLTLFVVRRIAFARHGGWHACGGGPRGTKTGGPGAGGQAS